MIVDAHAYCFPPADAPAGHASGAAHLRWVQVSHAGHHQPAWRVRDRAPATSAPLAAAGRIVLEEVPDVGFRVDHQRGRVVWAAGGEDCTKQFYPPALRDLEFTPHSLVAEMDYAGVDVCLLHTDPMLGRGSAYQAACVATYPDRLRSMAPVDEWRIPAETDAVVAELEAAVRTHRLHAIKFNPPHAYFHGQGPWDEGPFRTFWDAAVELGVPVFFTLGTGPAETRQSLTPRQQQQGYLGELRILMRWLARYPRAVCSLTHGFPYRAFLDDPAQPRGLRFPPEIWEPFQHPHLHLEVSFPVRLGDLFDFPYVPVWPALEEMVARLGARRLLWGTDMPFQNRFCTYRQSRRWLEGPPYCPFLTEEDRHWILGGTAARLLGLS
ncbi:MAG: amidohydrolase family protein [Gemmatimonadota bacterium]